MLANAALYLILQGPVTAQERWEEQSGYSPSTLATVIAGLICAAEFARTRVGSETADFILAYADWLAAHVEEWVSPPAANYCRQSRGTSSASRPAIRWRPIRIPT